MNPIEALAEQADQLFEQAEMIAETTPKESLMLFRKGIDLMFHAYFRMKQIDFKGDLGEIFQKCLEIEPEFEAIADAVADLTEDNQAVDAEAMVDAANEIWDFVTELISD